MARIIYSGLVTEIKGSIGGTTFQSNAYGYTVKNKARQKKPKTTLQNRQKIIMASASQGWRGLSDAQRALWDAWAASNPQYAKNNPSAELSGFAVFARWHAQAFTGGRELYNFITAPSYTIASVDAVDYTLTYDDPSLNLEFEWSADADNLYANIFISQPFKNTVNFPGSRVRYLLRTTNNSTTIDIAATYATLFGALPAVGESVFIDNVQYNQDNGMVYARQSAKVTVISA